MSEAYENNKFCRNAQRGNDMELTELKQSYEFAVLSLLFCKPSAGCEYLLFAELEYMPKYLARTHCQVEDSLSIDQGRAKLWYERLTLSVDEAYAIFQSASAVHELKIELRGKRGESLIVPIRMIAPDLQGQHFVVARGPRYCDESPVIARCWHGAQVDAVLVLDVSSYLSKIIADDKIATWISDHLCFSLADCVEYLSGVVAVYPNPYYCRTHLRMVPGAQPSGVDQIVIRYDRDCSAFGLKLLLSDQLNGTYGQIREVAIRGFETRVDLAGVAGAVGYAIVDSHGRIVDAEKFTSFIRCIKGDISVAKVEAHKCQDGSCQFLPVRQSGGFSIGDGDTSLELELDGKIRKIKYSRDEQCRAKNQYAFYKQPGEAEQLVRRLINSARQSVLIIDPYFSDDAAKMYLEAANVPVEVLCTEGGLNVKEDASDVVDHGQMLLKYVERLNSVGRKVSVCVTGHADLHDRFIVLDSKEVWLLGSSLKDIGASLSVVTKMNDGEGVAQKLITIKSLCSSGSLEDWLLASRGKNLTDGLVEQERA